MADKKAVATTASAEALQELGNMTPQEASYKREIFPRLAFKSQDETEGKGKAKKVITEAGTFIVEEQTDELDDKGQKVWEKTELGLEVPEAHIVFQRKQLRHYDESTEKYTSSPIFDSEEDIVPLFSDKKKIAEGLPKDLKAMYQYTNDEGKVRTKLEENRILYVLIGGDLHQLNLRGSSMYSFLKFSKEHQYTGVIAKLSSEAQEKGKIEWNQMTFQVVRAINEDEAQSAIELIKGIQAGIQEEKEFYAAQQMGDASAVTTAEGAPALPAGKDDEDF